MQKLLLLGDEAIAQGALDAGLSGMYAYPGTPSTEIMEYIQASKTASEQNIHREWSANEQDSRFYGKFAFVPCFEPSNQQEAYDMVFDAFEMSEKYKLPVLLRITTRLAHSRAC